MKKWALRSVAPRGLSLGGSACQGRACPKAGHDPIGDGREREADAGGAGIDQEVLQPRMASGRPELHQFEQANQHDRGGCHCQATLPIGEAEGQPDEEKGQRVLAVLAKVGMGAQARRPERCKGYGGGKQSGDDANKNGHPHRLARIGRGLSRDADQIAV